MKLRTAKRSSASLEFVPERSDDKPKVLAFRKSFSRITYLLVLIVGALVGLHHVVGLMFVSTAVGIVHSGLAELGADRTGRVLELCVRENVPVKKGAVLARIAVPDGDGSMRLAMATAARLRAQIVAERQRAVARARQESSRLLEQVSLLRDRRLAAQADLLETSILIKSYDAQIHEIKKSIAAFDELNRQQIQAEQSYLNLRVQKLDLEGKRDSLEQRRQVLEQRVREFTMETSRLEQGASASEQDAIEASNVALLEAELVEAQAQLELYQTRAISTVVAPEDGRVSWFQVRIGEIVVVGAPVLQFVPDRPAVAVVYPGDQLEGFPLNERVHITGAGFRALGTIIEISVADRERPLSLLKPYEKAVVGPAVLIQVDEVKHGAIRAGAEVKVSRSAVSLLHWIGL
jgi:multidrug resistance efflux pump